MVKIILACVKTYARVWLMLMLEFGSHDQMPRGILHYSERSKPLPGCPVMLQLIRRFNIIHNRQMEGDVEIRKIKDV